MGCDAQLASAEVSGDFQRGDFLGDLCEKIMEWGMLYTQRQTTF